MEELLHYYPRAYDEFKEPQPTRGTEGRYDRGSRRNPGKNGGCGAVWSAPAGYDGWIAGQRRHTALAWYNMPYLRGTLKAGERFIFRGRVVKKRGRLTMEQPEIYRPEQYAKVVSSMQPVYGQNEGTWQ